MHFRMQPTRTPGSAREGWTGTKETSDISVLLDLTSCKEKKMQRSGRVADVAIREVGPAQRRGAASLDRDIEYA